MCGSWDAAACPGVVLPRAGRVLGWQLWQPFYSPQKADFRTYLLQGSTVFSALPLGWRQPQHRGQEEPPAPLLGVSSPVFSLGTPTLMVLSSQKSLCLLPWQGSFPSHPHRAHLAPSSSSFPTCVGAPAGLLPPSPELFLKHPFFPSIFLPLIPVSGVYLGPALPFSALGCSFPHLQLLSPGSIPSWGHCDPLSCLEPHFSQPCHPHGAWICL